MPSTVSYVFYRKSTNLFRAFINRNYSRARINIKSGISENRPSSIIIAKRKPKFCIGWIWSRRNIRY